MRVLLLFVAYLGCSLLHIYWAVPLLSNADKHEIAQIQNELLRSKGFISQEMQQRYPIYQINGEWYLSMLGRTNSQFNSTELQDHYILFQNPVAGILTLKVPFQQLNAIEQLNGITYLQIAARIHNNLDKAIIDLRADSVHLGIGLPQGYAGKDVLIGITDWGFDYTHPVFYDTLLQQHRIYAAWDQYKSSGPAPNGFNYGTEYSNTQSLLAAGSDTANIYSYSTHGTHVAGIAGGGGATAAYRGVAYEAQFLFVTFLIDEGAVLDAWQWMYQKAIATDKRLVINMSWGLYHFGTLDGTSLLSQAITAFSNLGVVFVNSGGNNGNVNFHLKKTFTNDVLKSRIEFYDYNANPNMWGQSIHAWGEVGQSFSNGIIVTNTSNAVLAQSPLYSTSLSSNYVDTFLVVNQDTIWFNISADAAHPLNGRPQIRLRVKNTHANLRVQLHSTASSGTVHYWNVTELITEVGNWGMAFLAAGAGTTSGDNQNGISEPSCADDVISVAAYATQYATASGSLVGGALASFSSKGPRYDGAMKPDIAAPGVGIASAISSFTNGNYTSVANTNFNNTTYHFAKFSGTSMAAPMVAGVAALMLEANPYLSSAQVKEIMMQTARQDSYTGAIPNEGSPQWGAGKINAYAAVQLAVQTLGVLDTKPQIEWSVYPNPVQHYLHFTIVELPPYAEVIALDGTRYWVAIDHGQMSVDELPSGAYYIRLHQNGCIQQAPFIKI
ncbi:MAG: S8 family peptidase [Cryomorphaceae bacterium]|jgi:minor extracellular serine protease Vpr|nr:S8 family peptidase [Cryomorphaceae bacterium]